MLGLKTRARACFGASCLEQPPHHGGVRVEGLAPEHLTDDCVRRAAVGRRQAHPERFRQQVRGSSDDYGSLVQQSMVAD